jgi:hypothetical protein
MFQRTTRVLICLAVCGCHSFAGRTAFRSEEPCPSPATVCDDTDPNARLLPVPAATATVTIASYRPPWPACPPTHQVMAKPRPIVFQAIRPGVEPEDTASDPAGLVCDAPEAPLLRVERRRPEQNLAARQ